MYATKRYSLDTSVKFIKAHPLPVKTPAIPESRPPLFSASASFRVTLHMQHGNTLYNPCNPPEAGLTTTRRVATASYHVALARGFSHTRPPKCSLYIAAVSLQDYSQDALCLVNPPYHSSHASSHHHYSLACPTSPQNGPDSLQ